MSRSDVRVTLKDPFGRWLVQVRCDECGGTGGYVAQDDGGWYGDRCWCDHGWTTVDTYQEHADAVRAARHERRKRRA